MATPEQLALQALHQQMSALQSQIQQMQQPGHGANGAAGAGLAVAGSHGGHGGPRYPQPPSFGGRSNTLDKWLVQMGRQFEWYGTAGDTERVRMGAAFLDDAAGDWWASMPAPQRPADWQAFVSALKARFQPVTSAQTARSQMHSLTQGRGTVDDYVSKFRALLPSLDSMSEDDRVYNFVRGLNSNVATMLRVQGVSRLDDAIAMASRVGALGEQPSRGWTYNRAAGSNHAPMDLDAAEEINDEDLNNMDREELLAVMRYSREGHTGSVRGPRRFPKTKVPGLTPAQVKEYMAANKCFKCGEQGHRAGECKKPKQGNE